MALNKTILTKVSEETHGNTEIRDFILSLLQFESEGPGWYEKNYLQLLDEHCKEGV